MLTTSQNSDNPFQNGEVFVMSEHGQIRHNKGCNRFYLDLYWQGKRYRFYKYLGFIPCQTRDLAELFLSDVRSEINKGIFNPERYKNRKPLHLYVYAETWLKNLVISEATRHDYKNSLKNHILPVIGSEFLPDINYDKLRMLQNSIKRSNKGKYNVIGCLHKLLIDAYRSGHIARVPDFPGFKGSEAIVPPPIYWLEDENQWQVLNNIPIQDRFIFIFMKFTGCRPSEARAFRKVDIRKDHIIFEKTFGRGEILKEVKSKKVNFFLRLSS